ncbi:unnamed protein product [Clavelina lepadiformis]|uniref:J domain-containing protein n=1 Tax=Clavelina lepadiformis TaxID=159417 RepID=A0ABP0GUY6_CLALP
MAMRNYSSFSNREKNHYEILEVDPGASFDEIKDSYIEKSKDLHPDATASKGQDTHGEFIALNEAYKILCKPDLRRQYDVLLHREGVYQGPVKMNPSVKNPYRSASYKNPYHNYNEGWQNADHWTDYHNTYGTSRARRKMQQEIKHDFWQKHWNFSREHGGGGSQLATHKQPEPKKSPLRELCYMLGTMAVLSFGTLFLYYFSPRGQIDVAYFHQEHAAWLLSKVNVKNDKAPPAELTLESALEIEPKR